jgi:hypothetical protein
MEPAPTARLVSRLSRAWAVRGLCCCLLLLLRELPNCSSEYEVWNVQILIMIDRSQGMQVWNPWSRERGLRASVQLSLDDIIFETCEVNKTLGGQSVRRRG